MNEITIMQACVTEYPAIEQDAIPHYIKHLLINLLSKTALCHFGRKKKKKTTKDKHPTKTVTDASSICWGSGFCSVILIFIPL